MKALAALRLTWIVLAVVLYPLLFAGFLLIAIMPPLNMVGVPLWFMMSAGAVGGISNGLARTARPRAAQREARRYAPGVVPVQRTNAL
jgi:hypothetical protein